MEYIRKATQQDLARISEIYVFNYRLNFYPIFKSDPYYFQELQVPQLAEQFREALASIWVYDDGVVKGFVQLNGIEIQKLFVEPVLQGNGIGGALLEQAVRLGGRTLWALEKNEGAIRFYRRHGFSVTEDRKPEEDTTEYLIRLEK